MKKSFLIVLSSVLVATSAFAYAPSQDVPFQRMMNKTMADIIDKKAVYNGATPLQRASTMSAITSYLSNNAAKIAAGTATAGGAVIAAVSAPSWLLTLVAGTAISYGLSLGLNYIFNPNTQKIEGTDNSGINIGNQYARIVVNGQPLNFSDPFTAARYAAAEKCPNGLGPEPSATNTYDNNGRLLGTRYAGLYCAYGVSYLPLASPSDYGNCPSNQGYNSGLGTCVGLPENAPPPSTSTTSKTVSETYDNWISQSSGTPIDAPVPAATLAPLIDKAWRETAAQPGYEGVPYSYSNPVTTADVETYMQQNPNIQVKVGDLVSPQVLPSGGTSGGTMSSTSTSNNPFALSSPTQTQPGTDSNPTTKGTTINSTNVTNVNIDLGPNPNIKEPTLETPPTGQQILQPLLDIINPFKTLSFTRNATCPTYSIDLFGKTHTMDTHCILLEEHKQAIRNIMIAVFTIWSVMIILGA